VALYVRYPGENTVAIRRCVRCGRKGMDMVSNNAKAVTFRRFSLGPKGLEECQENMCHTITPAAA